MNRTETDIRYMRRCLQLAACGRMESRPNPMVGCVIVVGNHIVGEGYHVRCGEGHAEVNAFASVKPEDERLLSEATVYVSLEPCAHFGRTPPCADLIVSKHVKRVVVGCVDPFAKVQGRGIQKLHDAGIEVTVGVCEKECRWLNRRFFTFHSQQRPYIILKWAQSENGFIDRDGKAVAFSTPLTQMMVHKLRAEEDAILVGRVTNEREHPQLNVRKWTGRSPVRFVLSHDHPWEEVLAACRDQQLQSIIVEGGRKTLQSFLDAGLWDELRVEIAPIAIGSGTSAPVIPTNASLLSRQEIDGNQICTLIPAYGFC
ncbi:MAG: bifunctional diaminohydroxyphosphoribosylaminopyrimidine deaminase/5-amino-6-(5-phosphoribosylamino)uracil reductase RibD [Prevotella sp.]|nr:bifunctional diaminohydroxyphosphoribosylaminopyrimidine deaminase/5-amino-6-(5-phosphoribosylamino)uracil reductase RibD [Prevotella sp.]